MSGSARAGSIAIDVESLRTALKELDLDETWAVTSEATVLRIDSDPPTVQLCLASGGRLAPGERRSVVVRIRADLLAELTAGNRQLIPALAQGDFAVTGQLASVLAFLDLLSALSARHAERTIGVQDDCLVRNYRSPDWLSIPPTGVPQVLNECGIDQTLVLSILLVGLPRELRQRELQALWQLFAVEHVIEAYTMTRLMVSLTDLAVGTSEHESLRISQEATRRESHPGG